MRSGRRYWELEEEAEDKKRWKRRKRQFINQTPERNTNYMNAMKYSRLRWATHADGMISGNYKGNDMLTWTELDQTG